MSGSERTRVVIAEDEAFDKLRAQADQPRGGRWAEDGNSARNGAGAGGRDDGDL